MNLSRIMNYSSLLISKYHQSSRAYAVFSIKNPGPTRSPFPFSVYNIDKSHESTKLTLTSSSPLIISSRGMKVRGELQLRCKNCYFARKDGVMYVFCSSYPRHVQRAITKKPKYTWILTHAFQSKKRPW